MYIIFIIVIIGLIVEIESQLKQIRKQEKEIYNLKKELLKMKKVTENQEFNDTVTSDLNMQEKTKVYSSTRETLSMEHEKNVIEQTIKEKTDEEVLNTKYDHTVNSVAKNQYEVIHDKARSKNNMLLISGALLIVLAAMVFLLSTWNTTPDVIKVGVLVVLIGVFLGASLLADKKFNLEQTSNAFFYIAMAYIPLVLFAISLFNLFGEYFSITGAGKFVYLAISTVLLTFLYLFEYGKRGSKGLLGAGMFSEMLAVTFVTLIFTENSKIVISISSIILAIFYFIQSYNFKEKSIAIIGIAFQIMGLLFTFTIFTEDIFIVLFGMLLYSLALNLLLKKVDLKDFMDIYKSFNQGLFFTLTAIMIISNFYGWTTNNCTISSIINLIISILNFTLQGFELKKYSFVLNLTILSLILSVISLKGFTISFDVKLLIMSASVLVLYAINYLLFKKSEHKIIAYVAFNIVLLAILQIIKARDLFKFVPFVTSILLMFIEMSANDEETKYYIPVSFIVSFITLNIDISIANFICLIISIAAFMFYTKTNNMDELLNVFPMLAVIPGVYYSNLFTNLLISFDFRVILSLILIAYSTLKSVIKKEVCLETVFSVAYIVISIITFKFNIYISSIMVIIWSMVHLLTYENKDIFKAIIYIASLVIYNNLIKDLNINQLTLTRLVGYLTCLYLITRTIIKNSDDSYKIIEYIGTSLIFIIALFMYNGITDAMIFIGMLVVLVIWSFFSKIGPMFVVSLIAIVVNFFKLTKDFWLSIPWWGYLVTVGVILMAFAISNEASQNEVKGNFKKMIEKIKDDIDA